MAEKLKIKWKPKCPCCGQPLVHVFEGATGVCGVKCKKCGHRFLIDNTTMKVIEDKRAG
ncbi:MAG: hypothetical protein IJ719_12955 [Clostridia bacterium]|nr:hypothetical protein [Clostridia bacterium]